MRCKIVELGERDAQWPERYLLAGLEGEMFDDEYFEYDERTGWAKGYFDCDAEMGLSFPIFFSEVRIKEIR